MEGSFTLSRVKRLAKDSASCSQDTTTSLTSCLKVLIWTIMMTFNPNTSYQMALFVKRLKQPMKEVLELRCPKYLIRLVGCHLDLLGQSQESLTKRRGGQEATDDDNEGEACFTNTRLKNLYSLFIW